jgi:hypothetical protein
MERTADSFPEPVPAAGAMVDEPGETNTRLSEGDTLMRGRRLYLNETGRLDIISTGKGHDGSAGEAGIPVDALFDRLCTAHPALTELTNVDN